MIGRINSVFSFFYQVSLTYIMTIYVYKTVPLLIARCLSVIIIYIQNGSAFCCQVSLSDEEQSNTTIAVERHEIKQLVVGHMESLGLPVEECTGVISKYRITQV